MDARSIARLDQCEAVVRDGIDPMWATWDASTESERQEIVSDLRERFDDEIVNAILGIVGATNENE